jgi:hypothetical protein
MGGFGWNLTAFELMAQNDCTIQNSEYFKKEVGVWLRNGLDVLAIPAISISFITAFLILVQKKNRNRYPHTFIGYICLA